MEPIKPVPRLSHLKKKLSLGIEKQLLLSKRIKTWDDEDKKKNNYFDVITINQVYYKSVSNTYTHS
jgi:hypothetical protein